MPEKVRRNIMTEISIEESLQSMLQAFSQQKNCLKLAVLVDYYIL